MYVSNYLYFSKLYIAFQFKSFGVVFLSLPNLSDTDELDCMVKSVQYTKIVLSAPKM